MYIYLTYIYIYIWCSKGQICASCRCACVLVDLWRFGELCGSQCETVLKRVCHNVLGSIPSLCQDLAVEESCWPVGGWITGIPRPIYSQAAKFPSLPSASVSLYGLARALGVVLPHSIFFSRGAALVFAWTIAVLASLRFLPRKRCGRWSCKKQAGSSFWTSPIRPIIRFSWLLSTHFHTFPYRRNEHRRNTFAGSSSTSLLVDVWQLQDRPRSLCRFSRG